MKQKDKDKKFSENLSEDNNQPFSQDENSQAINNEDKMSEKESNEDEDKVNEEDSLQEKYDELNNSYLRLHAEFDNYRKRTLKEKMEIIKSGGEKVLSEMIPLIDDFERAIETMHQTDNKEALVEGIELIYTKFTNFLNQHGVQEIKSIGEEFDADKFEAVTTVPVQDKTKENTVIDCIQKGYALNEKVLRFPKVIVGK